MEMEISKAFEPLLDVFRAEFTPIAKRLFRETLDQAKQEAGTIREYLSLKEVTELHLDISAGTLNKWIGLGLPVYTIEGKKFIKKSDLYEFIEAHKN